MHKPKVSVIVPVYNTEKYLKQCIDSIVSQSLYEIEIIIVDDGSKEECALFCDEIAKTDARIKVIHKENEGLGLTRNVGVNEACGEYVGFVDSDDYIDSKMYESLYCAGVNNNADLVISGMAYVGGNTFGKIGEYSERHYFDKETVFEKDDIKTLLLDVIGALPYEADDSRYGVSVCKNIFKRSLFVDYNIKFESERKIISEDTLFMADYIKFVQKAVGIPGAFYCYRRNDSSLSKSYKSDRFEKVLIFLAELELHLKDIYKKEEYLMHFQRLVQSYARFVASQEIMYSCENKLGYSHLKERLKQICQSEMLECALKRYPWYKLPKKQALFAFAMKYKLYFLQKVMVILRAR